MRAPHPKAGLSRGVDAATGLDLSLPRPHSFNGNALCTCGRLMVQNTVVSSLRLLNKTVSKLKDFAVGLFQSTSQLVFCEDTQVDKESYLEARLIRSNGTIWF